MRGAPPRPRRGARGGGRHAGGRAAGSGQTVHTSKRPPFSISTLLRPGAPRIHVAARAGMCWCIPDRVWHPRGPRAAASSEQRLVNLVRACDSMCTAVLVTGRHRPARPRPCRSRRGSRGPVLRVRFSGEGWTGLPATSEGGVCVGGGGVLAVRCRKSSRLKTSTRSPSCSLWCFPTPTCSQA